MAGFEPATYGLRNRCSTPELHRRVGRNSYPRQGKRARGHARSEPPDPAQVGDFWGGGPAEGASTGGEQPSGRELRDELGEARLELVTTAVDGVHGRARQALGVEREVRERHDLVVAAVKQADARDSIERREVRR